jgi:hypothetical protein
VEEPATPQHGGARGGTDCKGGSGMEELATPGCSWTGTVGGGGRVPAGGRVPTLDDGAAVAVIDLSKWA